MNNRIISATIAATATATAIGLSAVAGMQRGGWESERALLIAMGVVLVVAAHLIPALTRGKSAPARLTGFAIWAAAMAATCYGHATFFVFAASHAGDDRASHVTAALVTASRDPVTIARDRAAVAGKLAQAQAERCRRACPDLQARRARLAGEIQALDVERDMAARDSARRDRVTVEREAAARDPMATALGCSPLLVGMLFAAVLEGVACLCWTLALAPDDRMTVEPVTAPETERHIEPVTQSTLITTVEPGIEVTAKPAQKATATKPAPPPVPDHDLDRARAAVDANQLRATVIEIRKFLGCSQSRAAAVAKQLKQPV
ncbi:hypothetical protein AQ843_30995 [Burkholderia pseudomallei]|uniref:hypothetical protein n=1 Tax=Burkholderia pseudomallei TaxID=28450 RepID=UPI000975CCE7|nr:hypothetical protein [Burkholderia pseudomallei]OMY27891.1 hypothetical protein AQ842_05765 [Burkholderia pseudomallei]OMY43623.1 hypothetical protein AQ843_30995 [Burkholderia pseudomallei]